MNERKYFWQDGLSIDESRVSAVVVAFLATTTVALWSYVSRGSISPEVVLLLQTLITAVTGINVANKVSDIFASRNNLPVVKQPVNEPSDIDKSRNML